MYKLKLCLCACSFPGRIAKKMLLAKIKSNYSSGAESSSDNEGSEKEEQKSAKKVKDEEDDDEEEEEAGRIPFIFFTHVTTVCIFEFVCVLY